MGSFTLDGEMWRRAARWGSSRGPEWFVRAVPPLVGVAACAIATERRRFVAQNLRRIRVAGELRDAVDTTRTFVTYASCLAETLGAAAGRGTVREALVLGELHVRDAFAGGRGVVLATIHSAGWEAVGALLAKTMGVPVLIAERAEGDSAAGDIQDGARRARGLMVAHVGDDPLAALPLARHLRQGGIVAIQIDRLPPGMRGLPVTLFGRPASIPEGPFRLAAVAGVPVLPVFASRLGHRRYAVEVHAPLHVDRRASGAQLDQAAQALAGAMESFVRARPTQWFHFRDA